MKGHGVEVYKKKQNFSIFLHFKSINQLDSFTMQKFKKSLQFKAISVQDFYISPKPKDIFRKANRPFHKIIWLILSVHY